MFLCRRWRTNWWRYAGSSILTSRSRLSKCPRSPLPVISQAPCAFRGADGGTVGGSADDRIPLFVARLVEQNVDISVPHGRGRGRVGGGRLLGLHAGQSSTAFVGAEHFPAATAEQIVDIPVPRGGRQDPDLPSAESSSGLPGTANQGFFALFPCWKKVRGWVRTWFRNWVRTSAHPRRRLSWRGFFTDAAGGVP